MNHIFAHFYENSLDFCEYDVLLQRIEYHSNGSECDTMPYNDDKFRTPMNVKRLIPTANAAGSSSGKTVNEPNNKKIDTALN